MRARVITLEISPSADNQYVARTPDVPEFTVSGSSVSDIYEKSRVELHRMFSRRGKMVDVIEADSDRELWERPAQLIVVSQAPNWFVRINMMLIYTAIITAVSAFWWAFFWFFFF